jgi:hypothetical protein
VLREPENRQPTPSDLLHRRDKMVDPLSVNSFNNGRTRNELVKTGTAAAPAVERTGTHLVGKPQADSVAVGGFVGTAGLGVGVVVTDGPDVVTIAAPASYCAYDTWCYTKKSCGPWGWWGKSCWNDCDDDFFFSLSFSSCYPSWSHWHSSCYAPTYICASSYTYRPWCWNSYYVGPVYHTTWCGPWYRVGYYTPVVYYVEEPAVVYTSTPTVVYANDYLSAPAMTMSEAWDRLGSGLDRDAMEGFAMLMQYADAEGLGPGLSTVGYALANAMLGYHESAAAAMRSAVRHDPQMLRLVPVDAHLATRLRDLISITKQRTTRVDQEVDALFMIAALHTMLHEDAAAYFAVSTARDRGDADQSTQGLDEMLSSRLSDDLYH